MQSGYLAAAIITSMVLLVVSGERQDELIAQLKRQAAIDSLTGLVTRRVLDNAAASALSGCGKRTRHRPDPARHRQVQAHQ